MPNDSCLQSDELIDTSLNEGVCMFSFRPDHYSLFCKLKKLVDNECFHLDHLDISTEVIDINPQHYTAWYFRRQIIKINYIENENKDRMEFLMDELRFVRCICERAPKCYQSWWHMRVIREWLGFDADELNFVNRQIENDAKNMYVWNHRTWFIRKYSTAESSLFVKELDFISKVIKADCRNNSAWCYRHFIFSNLKKMEMLKEQNILEEVEYIIDWLMFAPHNDSIWNYIISFFSKILVSEHLNGKELINNMSFEHAPKNFKDVIDEIYGDHRDSCHQVVYIKACMAYEEGDKNFASSEFERLQVIDPVRRFYWKWMANNLKY